jgi:hypothetical protein
MKTKKDAKSKGTILIADYDFGDVNIERAIIEGAGFETLTAQCKNEDSANTIGQSGEVNGAGRRIIPSGASVGAFLASYPSVPSHAASQNA